LINFAHTGSDRGGVFALKRTSKERQQRPLSGQSGHSAGFRNVRLDPQRTFASLLTNADFSAANHIYNLIFAVGPRNRHGLRGATGVKN
jgi:hypothetical protein